MYPSWGNFSVPPPPSFAAPGPRKPVGGNHAGQPAGFGGFEAPSSGSLFSSLQEQHRQQMQQLQMLHQKQLQSVLHHGNNASQFGSGNSGGYPGQSWHSEGSKEDDGGTQAFYNQEGAPTSTGPPAPTQGPQQPPADPQPGPPPPQTQTPNPPDSNGAFKGTKAGIQDCSAAEDKSLPLQEQQQLWYKQHLKNLQKLRQEKARQSQKDGDAPPPHPASSHTTPPPPPSDPPKSAPPPPPPSDEPPAPPLPVEVRRENVGNPPDLTDTPEVPKDPEEAARLQQLQAAAAQWQQVQQQRVGLQYQALMQQHEKLQQVLERYQTLIQQPPNLQSMSADLQLRHYEMQQQQFNSLFQDWNVSFASWYEQFQTYPHKNQLQDYERQWKQWQEQMAATSAHLQERVASLTAVVPFASIQYNSPMVGQFNQYPGQDMQMQQHAVNLGVQPPAAAVGPSPPAQQPPGFGAHPEAPAGPPLQGGVSTGIGVTTSGPSGQPQSFTGIGGPSPRMKRFDQPPQGFDGSSRVDPPQQRFDRPPPFDQPHHRFDGPPRFDQPRQRFDAPPRFDHPRQRFEGPPRFDQPRSRFEGPPRFEPPRQRFDGPPRFVQPRPSLQQHRPLGPSPRFESPPVSQKQEAAQPEFTPVSQESTGTSAKSSTMKNVPQRPVEKNKGYKENYKTNMDDILDDSLLGADGFFVQDDPIPQTLQDGPDPEKTDDNSLATNDGKPQPGDAKLSLAPEAPGENLLKPEGALKNEPLQTPRPPEIKPDPKVSGNVHTGTEPPKPIPGRGRGQPLMRGRGKIIGGELRESKPAVEETEEAFYDQMHPEEGMDMSEEQDDYNWQSSYEEFEGEETEGPPEDAWGPEEQYFQDEEYFETPMGPHTGRGRPPLLRGRPPLLRGPPVGRGFPPRGRPPLIRGGPPMGRGGPYMQRGGPPMGRGGPHMIRGGPPMGRGGPHMLRGGPPMGRGGPPMGRGGPPMGRGGPPVGRGGPPIGRGEPFDRHWEDIESAEYAEEEGDPYWEEWRPPMRGMRPPFPPGRGRPPRGHPGFMPPIRGRPPHRPMEPDLDPDAAASDPSIYHGRDPYGPSMNPEAGRGRRLLPPHEMGDALGEGLYGEGEQELNWPPPHARGPPMPPHDLIERGGMRRRPMGRGIGRGAWRPGAANEEYEEEYKKGFAVDYAHGEEGYRRHLAQDYPPEQFDDKLFDSQWDSQHHLEREYPPRMPPPEHLRERFRHPEAERAHPYPCDEPGRGELRIREYRDEMAYRQDEPPQAPSQEWDRPSRPPPPPGRDYPFDYPERRLRYEEPRAPSPPSAAHAPDLPEGSAESQAGGGPNVLALSQRQHEIILKAAQELKQIRELQEANPLSTDPQPAASKALPELPAGLLGLEIPPDVRNVLKGMTTAAAPPASESWESKPAALNYQPSLSAASVIPKTVDYGHGHEPGATVERMSYGERIILRPDPPPSDRGYEKELLGLRDPYSRDPYYDRRSDPYLERREYSRDREMFREKPEYERERFEREGYPPREREDRSPLRLAYRDRSGSRDPEDHYGRPGYDRLPFERAGLERIGPERYSSPYTVERRAYPEDRGPPAAAPLPPPPRVEKKPEIKNIDDILKPPGRLSRPDRIVIIMRGLPGSGKSHVAKLIRDKEVESGGAPPRVLVLDDYFMTEVERIEKDPDSGKKVKTKVMEYEYEPEMEDTYRSSMLKTFKKTLDDGFFPFIILDTINDKVKHFDQFWSAAKTKGFEVYVAEITADTQTCAKRNLHGRTHKDITKMSGNWEPSPRHMVRLDVRSLLQDAAIEEVEMEDFNPDEESMEPKREEEEESDLGYIPKSKWEMDTSEAKLDKLDGLVSGGKRKREGDHVSGLVDFLQLPDDYATRMSEPGKKRVRWADLEEQKDADRKRAIGFVVGQTDWEKITDESGQLAQRALNRTKYF
uniref:YLP motif-containing protein 1 n=1 Tax=Oryzias latipes TaxID=8090 RepID=A0A3P9LMZ3_ORYLA